ncbi:MAG: HEAT repeat domain-containing protein [Leptospiraceae bacterium]|nr:HEAT repeat domain-containing protein [Leptospiraceae bacterium]
MPMVIAIWLSLPYPFVLESAPRPFQGNTNSAGVSSGSTEQADADSVLPIDDARGSDQATLTLAEQSELSCAGYEELARRGITSDERAFALQALAECPSSPAVRRVLETAVRQDDFRCRARAFQSLRKHIAADSIPFLKWLYFEDALQPDETVRYYEYVHQGAVGPDKELQLILERGLNHSDDRVIASSLLGLSVAAPQNFEMVRPYMHPSQPSVVLIAALDYCRHFRIEAAGPYARRLLSNSTPAVQFAAIRNLRHLGGPLAMEALARLDLTGAHPTNMNALKQLLRQWTAMLRKQDPVLQPAYTDQNAIVHIEPTERSAVVGALERLAIVYILVHRDQEYRLPPENRHTPGNIGPWSRIRTADGIEGWVHSSRIRFYTP